MAYEKQLEELGARRARAKAMGSPKRLAERKDAGVLNARQRVDLLMDKGSFEEVGLLAASVRPEVREKTPADGVVSAEPSGYGPGLCAGGVRRRGAAAGDARAVR